MDTRQLPAVGIADTRLPNLVEHRCAVPITTTVEGAQQYFGKSAADFIAVLDGERLAGVCARREIIQTLGSRYGFALHAHLPISGYLMERPLLVREDAPLTEVFKAVTAREAREFYDDAVLVDGAGSYRGMIPARTLMRLQTEFLLRSIGALDASRREISEKNERMESDLAMAREVQFAMLPRESAPVGRNGSRLEFAHRYHPAGTMSGDFFDVVRLSDTSAGVLVCDVMGHGVRSALITAMIRAMLEPLRKVADRPGKLLTQLNRDLTPILHQAGGLMFVTAAYAVFDLASMRVRYSQAGHPTPLRWDSSARKIRTIACSPEAAGPALGLCDEFDFEESEEPLAVGDRWLLFTDGVFEASSKAEEFGMERLGEAFALRTRQTLDESLEGVMESVSAFCSGIDPPDDVCLIGVQLSDTHA